MHKQILSCVAINCVVTLESNNKQNASTTYAFTTHTNTHMVDLNMQEYIGAATENPDVQHTYFFLCICGWVWKILGKLCYQFFTIWTWFVSLNFTPKCLVIIFVLFRLALLVAISLTFAISIENRLASTPGVKQKSPFGICKTKWPNARVELAFPKWESSHKLFHVWNPTSLYMSILWLQRFLVNFMRKMQNVCGFIRWVMSSNIVNTNEKWPLVICQIRNRTISIW